MRVRRAAQQGLVMSALDVNGFEPLDEGQAPLSERACPQPATVDVVAAVLRDGAHRFPPVAAALHPLLCDAAARLIAIARATGREAVVITARDAGGILWHGARAGDYLYDSARPAWSDPRPGDADYLWGERARSLVETLVEAQWQQLAGPGRECLCLVARAGGAWLVLAGESGGPAEFHALGPDRPLELCGFRSPADNRDLGDLFRAMAPIGFMTVEQFARLAVEGERTPEEEPVPQPLPEIAEDTATEPVADGDAPPGLIARLLRRA